MPSPTWAGHTFNGWYTAATGGTKVGNGGASYTPTAAITLYAQWQVSAYTVTFHVGDYVTYVPSVTSASISASSSGHTSNQSYNPSATTSWRVFSVANGVEIIPTTYAFNLSIAGTTGRANIQSILTTISNNYKNSYAASARHLGMPTGNGSYGSTMNTTDKAIIEANTGLNYSDGHTFTGGNGTLTGSGVSVPFAEIITNTRQVVTVPLIGLTGGGSTVNPVTGQVIPIPPTPTGENNTVTAAVRPVVNLGIGPLVSGGSGTSSSPYVIAGAGATSYTITYNANGGSGAPATQTINVGSNATISATVPTRSNYSFLRWNTAANGSGTSYNPCDVYTGGTSITLYAQWGQGNYTATVTTNNGIAAPTLQANPTSGATGAILDIYCIPSGSFATAIPTGGVVVGHWEFLSWTCSNNTWTITDASNNSTTVRVGSGNATLTANYDIWTD